MDRISNKGVIIIRKDLIAQVVAIEWEMFQKVSNIGGRASCQDNIKTFTVMRSTQTSAWSEAVLSSYLEDLKEAKANGTNLLTEKYARMMEFTSPAEYANIQQHLAPIEDDKKLLIDKIVEINVLWSKELQIKFPYVRQRGRPTSAEDDNRYITSLETYLRCELATYSMRTVLLYYQNVLEQKSNNINGAELVMADMVKQYGFKSLEEANQQLKVNAQ